MDKKFAGGWEDLFDADALMRDIAESNSRGTREILVEMPIEKFERLAATPNKSDLRARTEGIRSGLERGEFKANAGHSNTPMLQFRAEGDTAKVVGHEGRARANALRQMGAKTIPVRLIDKSIDTPLRWDKLFNEDDMYSRNDTPKTLVNEDGSHKMNFPVKKEGDKLVGKGVKILKKLPGMAGALAGVLSLKANAQDFAEAMGVNPVGKNSDFNKLTDEQYNQLVRRANLANTFIDSME